MLYKFTILELYKKKGKFAAYFVPKDYKAMYCVGFKYNKYHVWDTSPINLLCLCCKKAKWNMKWMHGY